MILSSSFLIFLTDFLLFFFIFHIEIVVFNKRLLLYFELYHFVYFLYKKLISNTYNKEKLRNIITNENYKTINDDGTIFPPSNAVYCLISEALKNNGLHINPKHIYTILKNDRNGMYSAVLKAFGIDKKSIYDKSRMTALLI